MKTWEELSRSVIRKWDRIGVKAVQHILLLPQHSCRASLTSFFMRRHKTKIIKSTCTEPLKFLLWTKKSADTNFSAILASTQWKSSQIELAPMGLLCWKCWRLRWTLISGGSSGRAPSLHQYVKVALSFAESQMWLQISGCQIGVWFLGWNIWL